MRNERVYNINVRYKVSFGGPRDDRHFDMVFPHTMDFQLHVYKSYQKIIYDEKSKVKCCTYIDLSTAEQIAYVSSKGILFYSSVGPLFFEPQSVGFDMLGSNPFKK